MLFRSNQCLVAIAEVHSTPARRCGDGLVGPGAVRKADGDKRFVTVVGHARWLLRISDVVRDGGGLSGHDVDFLHGLRVGYFRQREFPQRGGRLESPATATKEESTAKHEGEHTACTLCP